MSLRSSTNVIVAAALLSCAHAATAGTVQDGRALEVRSRVDAERGLALDFLTHDQGWVWGGWARSGGATTVAPRVTAGMSALSDRDTSRFSPAGIRGFAVRTIALSSDAVAGVLPERMPFLSGGGSESQPLLGDDGDESTLDLGSGKLALDGDLLTDEPLRVIPSPVPLPSAAGLAALGLFLGASRRSRSL